MRLMRPLALLLAVVLLVSAILTGTTRVTRAAGDTPNDLSGIQAFVVGKSTDVNKGALALQKDSTTFYELAKAANFDYSALWKNKKEDVIKLLQSAQKSWMAISPLYEQMEGIVAGVPSLSKYDVILDAGEKGLTEYDVKLPDGKTLAKPGNLFGLLEMTLWGTAPDYITKEKVDFDNNGKQDFGEVLPDAVFLRGFADAMAEQTGALLKDAAAWKPTETDVFTALVTSVPTMDDFFNSWKNSRFVMGDQATQTDFAVISRLADINDNVGSWQVMWQGLSPIVEKADPARNKQITAGLADLKAYVDDLHKQEKGGKRFTPKEADLFASEAQNRATTIVGQISQVAAQLNITIPQG